MRSLLVAATLVVALACRARAELVKVDDFSGLVLWAGSGTNSAAFILQFSGTTETPASVAWGYRWSGTSTMQAMTDAIAGTTMLVNGAPVPSGLDDRLTIAGTQYSFGVFLSSITYNQTGLPAGWSQTTREIADNYFVDGTYANLYTRADAGGVWLAEGGSQSMMFTLSQVGASDISLTPGGWYGFVQGLGAETFGFSQPVAAVPEPSVMVAGVCGLAAGLIARWRHRRIAG
ncbi:MAG: hypothetical protein ACKOTB_03890 [Planctomycetia bacterium]